MVDHFCQRLLHPVGDREVARVGVIGGVAGVEQQVLHPHHVESREGAVWAATQGRGGGCRTGSEFNLRGVAAEKEGGEIPRNSRLLAAACERQVRFSSATAVHDLLPLLLGERRERRLRNRRVKDRNEAEVDPLLA